MFLFFFLRADSRVKNHCFWTGITQKQRESIFMKGYTRIFLPFTLQCSALCCWVLPVVTQWNPPLGRACRVSVPTMGCGAPAKRVGFGRPPFCGQSMVYGSRIQRYLNYMSHRRSQPLRLLSKPHTPQKVCLLQTSLEVDLKIMIQYWDSYVNIYLSFIRN